MTQENKPHWGLEQTQFFYDLYPEVILDAIDRLGAQTTGRVLALNSMENRVYEIELEKTLPGLDNPFVVAKFYRPGRWSFEQLQEEHQFMLDLEEEEIPICAPLKFDNQTIWQLPEQKIYYTLFPKRSGRLVDELKDEQIEILGRLIARVHQVGKKRISPHRPLLQAHNFGQLNLNYLLENKFISTQFEEIYSQMVKQIVDYSHPLFEQFEAQRIHGDCHVGNLLWRDEKVIMVDFDDTMMGPVAQDLWPLFPGQDQESMIKRQLLLESYDLFSPWDERQNRLFLPLRALRAINYSTWIAKRYEDPIFKQTFTWFQSDNYWHEQVYYLKGIIDQFT